LKITPLELQQFRGLRYLVKNAKSNNDKLQLLRQVDDALGMAISCLEQPHPNDESLVNALTMLFMSLDEGVLIKDKALFVDSIRRLRKVVDSYHPGDDL
jgi:hypothetical protein